MNKEELLEKYDWIGTFNNGFAKVRLNGKYGIINDKSKQSEIKYDWVSSYFHNGFTEVSINGKCGFISEKFKQSEIKYGSVWDFNNGFARVILNGEWGFINEKYKEVTQEKVLSTLCLREDKDFYYFKKILGKNLLSPHRKFLYELNKEYTFYTNELISDDCGAGFNLATESWIKSNFHYYDENIYIAKVPKKNNIIIIPTDMKKVRCQRAIITDEIYTHE